MGGSGLGRGLRRPGAAACRVSGRLCENKGFQQPTTEGEGDRQMSLGTSVTYKHARNNGHFPHLCEHDGLTLCYTCYPQHLEGPAPQASSSAQSSGFSIRPHSSTRILKQVWSLWPFSDSLG